MPVTAKPTDANNADTIALSTPLTPVLTFFLLSTVWLLVDSFFVGVSLEVLLTGLIFSSTGFLSKLSFSLDLDLSLLSGFSLSGSGFLFLLPGSGLSLSPSGFGLSLSLFGSGSYSPFGWGLSGSGLQQSSHLVPTLTIFLIGSFTIFSSLSTSLLFSMVIIFYINFQNQNLIL